MQTNSGGPVTMGWGWFHKLHKAPEAFSSIGKWPPTPHMPIILHTAVMMVLPGKYRLGTLPAGKGQQQETGRAQTVIDATIG